MRVTAEGMQTAEQPMALQTMDGEPLRGLRFNRPVPAQDAPGPRPVRWALPNRGSSRPWASGLLHLNQRAPTATPS